ncbi:hypothetical protein Tco_1128042 [Tanacetum coccineum]
MPTLLDIGDDDEEDEEEEHLALADSTVVALPAVDHARLGHPGCPISKGVGNYGNTEEWMVCYGREGGLEGPWRPGDFYELATMPRSHVLALRTTVVEQRALISGLQAADHQRQVQLTMALQLLQGLQTQMAEFQRQQGPARRSGTADAPAGGCSCSLDFGYV